MQHECENGAKRQCLETKTRICIINVNVEGVKDKPEEGDDVIKAFEDYHDDTVDDKKDAKQLLLPIIYNYCTG